MEVALALVPRRAERAERSHRRSVQREFGNERIPLGLIQENRRAGKLKRADAVEDEHVERQTRHLAPWQREAAKPASAREERLNAFLPPRRVSHDERAVLRVEVERGRIEHAAGLLTDLD